MIRFDNIDKNVTIKNITIDGDDKSNKLLTINNISGDPEDRGIVKLIDCTFINAHGNNTINMNQDAYAIRCKGAFESVNFIRCHIGSVYSPDKVSSGIEVLTPSGSDSFYTNQILLTDCVIENINDAQTSLLSSDSDGIKIFTPFDVDDSALIIKGCTFKNCRNRSVKSQVKNNIITSSFFLRDQLSAKVDIDLQYNGGIISDNVFYYNEYYPIAAISAAIRESTFRGLVISNNRFTYENGTVSYYDSIVVNYGLNNSNGINSSTANLEGLIVNDNCVAGWVKSFFRARLGIVENTCVISSNVIERANAFIECWDIFTGDALLKGTFIDNRSLDLNMPAFSIVSGNSIKFQPDKWNNNKNIRYSFVEDSAGIYSQIISVDGLSGINGNKKICISGQAKGNIVADFPIDVHSQGATVKIKAIYTYSGNDNSSSHSIKESYLTRNQLGSLVIETPVLDISTKETLLGKWEIVIGSSSYIILRKTAGSLTTLSPLWIEIEGNNID